MSEVIQLNAEQVQEIAGRKGLVCFIAEVNELQLDFDSPIHSAVFDRVQQVIKDNNGLAIVDQLTTISPGGKGRHVYIRLDKAVANSTRIALQACLGSDPVREVLSLIRLMSGSDAPTALFENKAQAFRVRKWRGEV